MRTITAMFDSRSEAEAARDRLARAGIGDRNVAIHDKTSIGRRVDRQQASSRHDSAGGTGFSDIERQAGDVYGGDPRTSTDYAGNTGLKERQGQAATDGDAPMHRNAVGDFVDERTGKNVADKNDGIHRNAIGDFVDERGKNIADTDDHMHRNAIGDFVEDGSGKRVGYDDDTTDTTRRSTGSDDNDGIWDSIKSFFTGDHDVYEEGMRRGGYLVTARVEDGDVDRASEILEDDGVIDLDERQASWRNQGWTGGSAATAVSATGRPRVRSYDWDRSNG